MISLITFKGELTTLSLEENREHDKRFDIKFSKFLNKLSIHVNICLEP